MNDDNNWDFGFTAVDENELDSVQELKNHEITSANELSNVQNKLDNLYNAITPLLNNLKMNPEKEYILWPNRVEKVEEFENHLRKLYNE